MQAAIGLRQMHDDGKTDLIEKQLAGLPRIFEGGNKCLRQTEDHIVLLALFALQPGKFGPAASAAKLRRCEKLI